MRRAINFDKLVAKIYFGICFGIETRITSGPMKMNPFELISENPRYLGFRVLGFRVLGLI